MRLRACRTHVTLFPVVTRTVPAHLHRRVAIMLGRTAVTAFDSHVGLLLRRSNFEILIHILRGPMMTTTWKSWLAIVLVAVGSMVVTPVRVNAQCCTLPTEETSTFLQIHPTHSTVAMFAVTV